MEDEDIQALLGEEDVFMRLDASGRVLRFVAGRGHVGRPASALIGRLVEELLPEGEAAHVRAALVRVSATGAVQVVEHRRPSPLGERSVRARLSPATNGETVAHVLDVTDADRTRAALAESLETQRLFAQAATDACFDCDVATDRVLWTDSISSALGYPTGTITDLHWWNDRLHPDERDAIRAESGAAMADPTRALWASEYRFRAADGRWLIVFNRSLFIRDAAGKTVRVVGSLIDVTEQRRLEQRLRMADRLSTMGTFAAGLAHEVRNPLSATIGNLVLARRAIAAKPSDLHPLAEMLADAEEGAHRIRGIVDGLATFNRDSDGNTDVELRSVVERALIVAGHDLTRRARVELDLAEVPAVPGDAQQLGQVVLNLLANAQHSLTSGSPDEQRVRISLRAGAEHHVVLEVEDTGQGILPEHLPRLFEPFFTTKPDGVGTGLGLAICREIVAAHGGTIEAESVLPHGAVFRVVLPTGGRARS